MRWLYGLKIAQKLILAFGCVAVILIGVTVYTISSINNIVDRYERLLETTVTRHGYLADVTTALNEMRISTAFQALALDNPDVAATVADSMPSDEQHEEAFNAAHAATLYAFGYIQASPTEMLYFQSLLQLMIDSYLNYSREIMPGVTAALADGDRAAMQEYILQGFNVGNVMSESLRSVADIQANLANADSMMVSDAAADSIRTILWTFLFTIIIIVLFCIFMTHVIRAPITKLRVASGKVAGGDLTYPISQESTDEIGMLSHDIASMVASISELNKSTTIMDSLDILVCVVDDKQNIIYVNKTLSQLYNFNLATQISLRDYDLPEGQGWLHELQKISNVITNGTTTQLSDVFWDSKLGRWLEINTAPIRWVDGSLAQFYTFTNVTEKKTVQDQRLHYESMLQEAILAAQVASHAKSVFIANTSHEIRTPMNSIIGYSELALNDELISEKTRTYLNNILENSKWLLQIINDILDLSKIESGKIDIETIPFDLHTVLSHCQAAISPLIQEKNLALHFYAEPVVGKLMLGSPARLIQIFLNLLSNAVKFTNSGAVKLSSVIVASTDNSCTLNFEVRDSGIGMSPEQIAKIFEPFLQADEDITRKYTGSGLGLTITKSLIEAMGGELHVESTPRVGSKFSFTLTFNTIDAGMEDIVGHIEDGQIAKPMFDGEVLICEDNAMNQGVISEHLEAVGLRPTIASNGRSGVDIVEQRVKKGLPPFGLIFMDVNMPVMDGLEASSLILRLKTGTPIVAMTANVMINDRESYESCGMEDIIGKPFTTQELWRCLLKYFVPINWSTEDMEKVSDGKEKMLRKIMAQFVENNSTACDDIETFLAAGDVAQAYMVVHNLKTHAGFVEKHQLRAIAAKVEKALGKRINSATEEDLAELRREFDLAIQDMKTVLEQEVQEDNSKQ